MYSPLPPAVTQPAPIPSTGETGYKRCELSNKFETEKTLQAEEKVQSACSMTAFEVAALPPLDRSHQAASSSPSTRSLSAGSPSSPRRFTNTKNLSKLKSRVCPGHSRAIVDLQYTHVTEFGSLLLSSSLDGRPMFRYESGDWIGTFIGHKGGVWCSRANRGASSSDTAKLVVTASGDFAVRLWDGLNGNCLSVFEHRHIVKACDFSYDGLCFYTGGKEKILRQFDIEQQQETWCARTVGEVSGVVPLKDTSLLLTHSSETSNIDVWDIRVGSTIRQLPMSRNVQSIQQDHEYSVLTSCAGSEVHFRDLNSQFNLIQSFKLDRKNGDLACATTIPKLNCFVTASNNSCTVDVWDLKTGSNIFELRGHHGEVQCIAAEPSGKNFATGSNDGVIRIWSTDHTTFK